MHVGIDKPGKQGRLAKIDDPRAIGDLKSTPTAWILSPCTTTMPGSSNLPDTESNRCLAFKTMTAGAPVSAAIAVKLATHVNATAARSCVIILQVIADPREKVTGILASGAATGNVSLLPSAVPELA
jgi:hypothetical protein